MYQLVLTCRGTVDLSPGCDEDVDTGLGVRADYLRPEQVQVYVVSPGREAEHQTTLLNIHRHCDTVTL